MKDPSARYVYQGRFDVRRPPFLKKGDTIGFAAPSFGAVTEPYATRFEAALRNFEKRSYRVKVAESCYMDDGIGISTDPKKAAADLISMYLDPEVDAVISVGGGELMNETLSCLDMETIRNAPPKWFMGYSDNTHFVMPLCTVAGVPAVYGPCATSFGKAWEGPEETAMALLEGRADTVRGYGLYELPDDGSKRQEDPLSPYLLSAKKELSIFAPDGKGGLEKANETSFNGLLLGGCLDVVVGLYGTPYDGTADIVAKGTPVVWALEACDLSVFDIRRTLWRMRERGLFDTAKGFVIGRPLNAFAQRFGELDRFRAVTDVLAPLGVPVICDADIGHIPPMMPLIIGSDATVSAGGNDISIKMTLG